LYCGSSQPIPPAAGQRCGANSGKPGKNKGHLSKISLSFQTLSSILLHVGLLSAKMPGGIRPERHPSGCR
jgi:hypothetical protein